MNEDIHMDWDPRDDSVLADQRQAYDKMRAQCPVARSEFLNWSLFRHADIIKVLADPGTYSSETRRRAIPNGMDQPEHTLYRRALEPYFSSNRMAEFEPQFRLLAVELLQQLSKQGTTDYVSEFAEPFSFQAHCDFLGWDPGLWQHLIGWTHGNLQTAFTRNRETGRSLAEIYAGIVTSELNHRREAGAAAGHDITSSLLEIEVDGQKLSDENIVSILRNWTAGHGTVAAGIGILGLHLAQDQDLQQRLRSEPALVAPAVDEILRVDGPLVSNRRTTTRDVEIGGRTISKGENLTLMWIAANRDPEAFDDPDTVRLDRDSDQNLVFGQGIHNCVAAPLARLLLRIAAEELLTHTDRIEISDPGQLTRTVYPSNGLTSLRLRLS